jgi:hypothetical protein
MRYKGDNRMRTFAPFARPEPLMPEPLMPEPLMPEPSMPDPLEEEWPPRGHRTARPRVRLPRLPGGRWLGGRTSLLAGRTGLFGRRAHRLKRRTRWLVVSAALLLPILLVLLFTPALNAPLTSLVSSRIAQQMACPGTHAKPPKVTLRGGGLAPQLLRGTLSEIELRMPDAAVSGVNHATFAATLRDVSQPKPGTSHVGRIDASITIGFASMPSLPDMPKPTFGRAPDGSLTIAVTPPADAAKNVKVTLLSKLELHGEAMKVVPQRLLMFGKTVPAERAESQTGGVRTEQLPHLPDGLAYRSVTPERDGLHVALGGVVTTPFSTLPTNVDGQTVTYGAKDGMLSISTSKDIPLIGGIPVTIFAAPRLDNGTLALVPQAVEIFGSIRKPDDPIAAIVLSMIKQEALSRKLPSLPSGVRYRSVSVDNAGIKMAIDGTTVKPFSEMPATVDGRPTTYGAQDGLLAVTASGGASDRPMPVVLYARPTIVDTTLDLAPQQIEMFGIQFPARDVLAMINTDQTRFPLQALPANLVYRQVEILADGLRVTVSGKNVTLRKDSFGGMGC